MLAWDTPTLVVVCATAVAAASAVLAVFVSLRQQREVRANLNGARAEADLHDVEARLARVRDSVAELGEVAQDFKLSWCRLNVHLRPAPGSPVRRSALGRASV